MRIMAGELKGLPVSFPKHIRPTQDKVRKSLFDLLKGAVKGAAFLDLFAGSGVIGIEALSREASRVSFVESDRRCIRIIRENVHKASKVTTGLSSCLATRVICADVGKAVEQFFRQKEAFDIVFLDPPYYHDLAKNTLQLLGAYDIVSPFGLVIVQHFRKDGLPIRVESLVLQKALLHGQTQISLFQKT